MTLLVIWSYSVCTIQSLLGSVLLFERRVEGGDHTGRWSGGGGWLGMPMLVRVMYSSDSCPMEASRMACRCSDTIGSLRYSTVAEGWEPSNLSGVNTFYQNVFIVNVAFIIYSYFFRIFWSPVLLFSPSLSVTPDCWQQPHTHSL